MNIEGSNYTFQVDVTLAQNLLLWHLVGGASGMPDSTTMLPANFYVDYVHVYQRSGGPNASVTPQANYGGPGDALGSGNSPGV